MIIDTINEFRRQNNKPPVLNWMSHLNDYCLLHSLEMARRKECYHSEEFYRPTYGEIVAKGSFLNNFGNSIRYMIFEVIGKSPEHRELLLNWNTMGYGYNVDKEEIYLTIRGR